MFEPWREAALQRGYAAVIALPLRVAGAAFGVLAIYSEQVGSFESSEVELLTEMANNLAYGITAIRAQEERTAGDGRAAGSGGEIPAIGGAGSGDFLCGRGGSAGTVSLYESAGEDDSRLPSGGLPGGSPFLVESLESGGPPDCAAGGHVGKKDLRFRWNTACGGRMGGKCGCGMRR